MEILGLKLVPSYRKGLDYEVYRDGKLVGFITFVWGYVRVSKYVCSNNGLTHEEVPLASYYYWQEGKMEEQYPPGYSGAKLIKKCLRRLKFSLFIDKLLLRD